MLFLFGSRWNKKTLGQSARYICKVCQQTNPFELVRARQWFTLFFIPILPLATQYQFLCPHCRNGARVKKEEFDSLLAAGSGTTRSLP